MAQVCGGSNYDTSWQWQKERALKLLRLAADAFAARKLDLPPPLVLRIVLRALYSYSSADIPITQWGDVQCSVPKVLGWLNPNAPASVIEITAAELENIFDAAVDQWSETGYPEGPRTDELLEQFLAILFHARFIKHPPHEGPPRLLGPRIRKPSPPP